MSKSISLNHTDSGVSGVTTLTHDRAILNFGADYRIKVQEAAKNTSQVVLTNMTSPIDKPETFKVAATEIKDIYKGTSIDVALYSPTRKGVSVLCALNDVYTVTDSVTTESYDLPISGHFVLKVPADANITPAMVDAFLGRLISGLYESGSATTARLSAILRGSLIPTDL